MTSRVRRPERATEDGTLADLNRRLTQHRARARRAWRQYVAADELVDFVASSKAHRDWSDAVEDALTIVEAISLVPMHDLGELLIAFEAIWWWIGEDDNVLDGSTRRWLERFRRSLRRLAREG
jgi:hypothetical protein